MTQLPEEEEERTVFAKIIDDRTDYEKTLQANITALDRLCNQKQAEIERLRAVLRESIVYCEICGPRARAALEQSAPDHMADTSTQSLPHISASEVAKRRAIEDEKQHLRDIGVVFESD